MSAHQKTRVFTQDRKDLKGASPTAGLDFLPAATATVTAARAENGVNRAMPGQNLLTERLERTRGFEAERRALFSISKPW